MSKKKNPSRKGGRERRISVRAVRRDPPDLSKLARAVVALALAQAEADAEAQTAAKSTPITGTADASNGTTDEPEQQDGHEA